MVAKRNNGGTAPTAAKTKLVIAEDQALLAGALPDLLHTAAPGEIEVVQICLNRSQLFRTLRKTTPDVLLYDIWMPNSSGDPATPCNAQSLEAIKRQSPNTAILLLSGKWDTALTKSLLDAGAAGFLDKGALPEQICHAIARVRRGGRYIEPRLQSALDLLEVGASASIWTQLLKGRRGDVLRLLLAGLSPTEIAKVLPIGKKYVDKKIREVKSILGVKTHILILYACVALGITNDDDHVIAHNTDHLPHYDALLALRIVNNDPSVRDRVVNNALDQFSAGGELAALFDISGYRRYPTQSRALAHSGVTCARQAAMPRLELLCQALDTALEQGEFVTAENLGRKLPALVASVRAAVTAASAVRSAT